MASRALIPRFLLPLRGPLWRGLSLPASQSTITVRFASSSSSTTDGEKPIVLEKPARFNPPSHGSRLKRNSTPKHYGPVLTSEEVAQQNKRSYPGMMAPEGTWAHWLWTNRLIHTCISMGTLLLLGLVTFFMNYAYHSDYKELVPPLSDLWSRPIYFFLAWKEVISLDYAEKNRKAIESRNAKSDDVMKRRYFMKMHGIEAKNPVLQMLGEDEGPTLAELEKEVMKERDVPAVQKNAEEVVAQPRKKWFGIF